jgi:uncharacterized protein
MAKNRKSLPIAVIDNTLLSRLTKLEIVKLLPIIFQKILIPVEVQKEAYKAENKKRLRNLISEMKGFFEICNKDDFLNKEILKTILDIGEASAIAQAEYVNASIIIDEKKGRKQASMRELEVIPTIKILCLLKENGVINEVRPFLDKLDELGFYLSKNIRNLTLKQAGELADE